MTLLWWLHCPSIFFSIPLYSEIGKEKKEELSNNEDPVDEYVSNGDSFENVKKTLKNRSKVHPFFFCYRFSLQRLVLYYICLVS